MPIEINKPEWLSVEASPFWDEVVSHISNDSRIISIDWMAIALYCELYAEFVSDPAEFQVGKMAQLRGLMASIGLAPDSKIRMSAAPKPERSPFDDLD